ncbi:MAG: DeoR family transcriptional regulator [Parcubacteria group bacterium]|nr:DeoR family transcriptional regulator [Parcubacteria group bacterium]
MLPILIFLLGLVIGGIVVWSIFWSRKEKGNGAGIVKRQAEEKKRNKEAILELLETQTPLTNNHIEQLLGISDATATRYLDELEKEGKIRQVGETGRSVYYEKI